LSEGETVELTSRTDDKFCLRFRPKPIKCTVRATAAVNSPNQQQRQSHHPLIITLQPKHRLRDLPIQLGDAKLPITLHVLSGQTAAAQVIAWYLSSRAFDFDSVYVQACKPF
jgi:hypothetical protein